MILVNIPKALTALVQKKMFNIFDILKVEVAAHNSHYKYQLFNHSSVQRNE